MLDRIFPSAIDNNYHGQSLAIYLFYFIIIIKMGLALMVYDPSIVSVGLAPAHVEVLASLLLVLLAMRYRSLIPILYMMLFLYYSVALFSNSNQLVDPMIINTRPLSIYALVIIGFILSTTGERCYYRNNAVLKRP